MKMKSNSLERNFKIPSFLSRIVVFVYYKIYIYIMSNFFIYLACV